MIYLPRVRLAILLLYAGLFAGGDLSESRAQIVSMAHAGATPHSNCTVSQLSLGFADAGGVFNGMSQGGVLLVLRNISPVPCRVQVLPRLHFEGGDGQAVDAYRRVPRGMHPGPVLLPVLVMPDAELTARLRWVSADVYDGHHCISPATAVLDLPGGALRQSFARHMCASAGSSQFFDQGLLRPDPAPPTP